MHIEPHVVDGAKIILSYATAAGSFGLIAKLISNEIKKNRSLAILSIQTIITTALTLIFFEALPHYPVGISEVHLILGSTLLLIFGPAATALGLASGLLLQGLLFAPFDLPQYGMNVTTLILPLFAISLLAKSIIPPSTAYVDLQYRQALLLSTVFQGGIVAWVAFWAIYGQGFSAVNMANIGSFGIAYMSVILLEPLADLAVLALAKKLKRISSTAIFNRRIHCAA